MKRYHSKLLVLGEYTILNGSQGIAVPLPLFGGEWMATGTDPAPGVLSEMVDYLKNMSLPFSLDTDHFKKDIEAGWHFASDIPFGYGVGSSGALTAGVYDRYVGDKKTALGLLKKELGLIESFFHGTSSGIDPLIAYLNVPILMQSKSDLVLLSADTNWSNTFFLIDTGISRKTEPLVNVFLEKLNDDYFKMRVMAELVPAVDDAIEAYLQKDQNVLFEQFHQISFFQYKYFREMIPPDFLSLWLEGLAGDQYKLKLCGAGGGGFILGIGDTDDIGREVINV